MYNSKTDTFQKLEIAFLLCSSFCIKEKNSSKIKEGNTVNDDEKNKITNECIDKIYLSYIELINICQMFKKSVENFSENPSEENLKLVKDEWIIVKFFSSNTKGFKFHNKLYENKINYESVIDSEILSDDFAYNHVISEYLLLVIDLMLDNLTKIIEHLLSDEKSLHKDFQNKA